MTVTVFVPEVPEFGALVRVASSRADCTVSRTGLGYWRIDAAGELHFHRKELELGPALWNSALSGGFRGRIAEFDRNELRIVSEDCSPS